MKDRQTERKLWVKMKDRQTERKLWVKMKDKTDRKKTVGENERQDR